MIWLSRFWLDLIWFRGYNQIRLNHLTHYFTKIKALIVSKPIKVLLKLRISFAKLINLLTFTSKLGIKRKSHAIANI
jgi:hypothetical protein